jgi:hypothetical protein
MPIELEITELNEYQRAKEYIDSILENYITLNMLKCYGIREKVAKHVLKKHKNTMLCEPSEFGSNKFRNEKLYKKVTNDELINLCNTELKYMKKNKNINDSNFKSYINSGLSWHMMNKYFAVIDSTIINKL